MPPKKAKKFRNIKKSTKAQSAFRPNYTEKVVLDTLSYAAVFDYPLSFYQVSQYLINKNGISASQLSNALASLVTKKQVVKKNERYFLTKQKAVSWDSRKGNSLQLIEKVWDITQILQRIPWVEFVGVTGSVAAFNAKKDDDVDVLIISQKGRLWLTRGFVYVVLILLGELHRDGHNDNKICPNIFMEEGNLAWNKKSRNLYSAREVLMVYPLFDRGLHYYFDFMCENSWAFDYFGNIDWQFKNSTKPKFEKNIVMDLLESLARVLQIKYMSRRKTTEVTKKDLIHFNLDDATNYVLEKYSKIKQAHGV